MIFSADAMKLPRWMVCVFLMSSLWAQDNPAGIAPPEIQRPRIGLVLEGGGALGLAHVGVIKWLQENHIPVDMIAGTSMGGVVGGIYASGESPDQIRRL